MSSMTKGERQELTQLVRKRELPWPFGPSRAMRQLQSEISRQEAAMTAIELENARLDRQLRELAAEAERLAKWVLQRHGPLH